MGKYGVKQMNSAKEKSMRLKIGLDVHGVITRYHDILSRLTKNWVEKDNHEVHIMTGASRDIVEPKIKGISFTHFFSIVDYHRQKGTTMEFRNGGWWMPPINWDSSKGEYAKRVGLDIHFDDSPEYAQFFPRSCEFVILGNDYQKIIGKQKRKAIALLSDFCSCIKGEKR
jgi:hypothetical protein